MRRSSLLRTAYDAKMRGPEATLVFEAITIARSRPICPTISTANTAHELPIESGGEPQKGSARYSCVPRYI